jgi:hypothetical protein
MFCAMTPAAPSWGRKAQWILVAGWVAVISVLLVMDLNHEDIRKTPWGCAAGALSALAHGMWISLDCRIQNRRVGAWRFGAFFLGPLVIWAYLVSAYGLRALWMIPLSVVIYFVPFGMTVILLLVRPDLMPV